MTWPEEIREGFPPPHREEPANLRRDIADELADHLACALRDEMRTKNDEPEARRAVLQRFGNPRRLARRLWFDAMKEAIMKDRIMMAAVVVLALAVLAMAAFSWRTNQAMLATLEKLAKGAGAAGNEGSNRANLTVRVALGSKDGKPVEGAPVTLNGKAFSEEVTKITEITDDQGMVRIGPIRAGTYYIECQQGWRVQTRLTLYGGQPRETTIIIPTAPTKVSPQLALPDDLKNEAFFAQLRFEARKETYESQASFDAEFFMNSRGEFSSAEAAGHTESGIALLRISPTAPPEYQNPLTWPAAEYRLTRLDLYCQARQPAPLADRPGAIVCEPAFGSQGDLGKYEALPDAENNWKIEPSQEAIHRIRGCIQWSKSQATPGQPLQK